MTKETHSTARKNRAPENRRQQSAEIFGNSSLFFLRRMLRTSGTKFDTNSIFSKNIAPFIDRGGYLCYNKSVKNSPIRSVFGWYGTDKVYSHRARFVVHDGESVNICSARRGAQGAAGAVFISNYIRVSRLNTSLVLVCFGIYAGIY